MDALALVGLAEQADKHAASLPYGQQRLVEIARALASEPRLLMLDEPAAGMNAAERADLVKKIARIRDAGITVLIVEHDIGLVMGISDRVNVLDHGLLIASGTPDEVKKEESVIKAYLGTKRETVEAECEAGPEETGMPAEEDMLRAKDIVTCYGSIQALHGVSLSVPEGKVVALLGANGAGKSTFIRDGLRTSPADERPGLLQGPEHHRVVGRAHREEGPRARARRPPALPDAHGGGQPAHGRLRAPGLAERLRQTTSPTSTSCSPSSASAGADGRRRSPAGSSRCWPSAGP